MAFASDRDGRSSRGNYFDTSACGSAARRRYRPIQQRLDDHERDGAKELFAFCAVPVAIAKEEVADGGQRQDRPDDGQQIGHGSLPASLRDHNEPKAKHERHDAGVCNAQRAKPMTHPGFELLLILAAE